MQSCFLWNFNVGAAFQNAFMIGKEYSRKNLTKFLSSSYNTAMTDTQPLKHSPRVIAVNSTRYTYMRRAMIIPTCVVQICT